MLANKLLGAAAAAEPAYIEDVFSTYLYTGNGSTQTITNGIDLAGEGGLVWLKGRSTAGQRNGFFDTQRGVSNFIWSDSTAGQNTFSGFGVTGFGSSGFTIVDDAGGGYWVNGSGINYASWAFRKAEKFFDVVTGTTNASGGATFSHSLGSAPGCIIVKATGTTGNWGVWHRSIPNGSVYLNLTNAQDTSDIRVSSATSTSVTITNTFWLPANQPFVAYLFAHNAGGFGDDGSESVISCGNYTGNGSTTGPEINLGWEPQWLLVKRTTDSGYGWFMFDNMRGFVATSGGNAGLYPNTLQAESSSTSLDIFPTATGFQLRNSSTSLNASGKNYIYIAIRRGPMKTPEAGTEVFSPEGIVSLSSGQVVQTGFVTDMSMAKFNGTQEWLLSDRLRNAVLYPNTTGSEGSLYGTAGPRPFDVQDGFKTSSISGNYALWGFRRAPGFFDVVTWKVDGTGNTTLNHNLGVIPEMIISKNRNSTSATYNWWVVGHKDLPGWNSANENDRHVLRLNTTAASVQQGYHRDFTASTIRLISVASGGYTTTDNVVAYLFATVAGVSKVGSYTGTGTTQQINCGFSSGARFVLIKRTDSTGNWYLYDSGQGIVSGNDPYFLVNTSDGQYIGTDYIDTYSAGFEISSTAPAAINANGGTFIFLAIS